MANYPPAAPFFGMPPYAQGFPSQSAPPPPPPQSGGPTYQNAPQLPPQQPAQQQAHSFQQNASLPTPDFQALGLNSTQLAALWQHVQSGAPPPPPPFPPPFTPQAGFAPPPPPPLHFPPGFQPPAVPSFPLPPPQALPGLTPVPPLPGVPAALPASNNRVMEIVHGDKEEGELSDEPGSQDDPGRSWSREGHQRAGKDLQKCGLDPKLVKEAWTSLGFPLDQQSLDGRRSSALESRTEQPSPSSQPKTGPASAPVLPAAQSAPSTQPAARPQPTVGTAGINKATAGPAASSPTDRAAYIARLMAAKNSKASSKPSAVATSATPSPAPASIAVAQAPSRTDSATPAKPQELSKQEDAAVTDPAVLAAQKKEAQNELLRKKIEALKIPRKKAEEEARAKAQAVAASLSASRTPSSSGASAAAMSKSEIPVRPAQQETAPADSTPRKDSQPSPSMPLQSPGGIPGLFMTSAAPQVAPKPTQDPPIPSANRGRKRPVASDFEDLQQSRTPPAFKRPFGQSQSDHEQVIIEVSDDETAGSVMDIDEADELQPSAQPSVQPPKGGANRNLPPLTNFPARPGFSRQGSAHSTPPAQPPIPAARVADLKRKEEELAALKKLIAEKERQRLARAQSSRAQTPATPTHQPSQAPQLGSSPAASAPVNRGIARVQPDVRSESVSRAITPSGALTSAPQSPAEPDWKRRRRAEIQSGISAFDADLNSNMSRLEQLRREMEQIEAENKRRQQEKESLINELEGLGIDTEGMPHEELQAKKDEIMHQQQQEANAAAEALAGNSAATSKAEATDSPQLASVRDVHPPIAASKNKVASESSGDRMSMSDGEIENESDTTEAEMDMSDSDAEKEEPAQIQTASNAEMIQASEALAEPAVTEETQPATACPAETSEQEDTEDFYSSDARQEVSASAPEAQAVQADHSSAESNQPSLQADDYAPPGDIEPQSSGSGSTSSSSSEWDPQLQSEEHGTGELTGVALENEGDARMEAFEPVPDVLQPESTNQDVTDELQTGDASSEAMDEDEDDYDPSDMLPNPSPSAAASDYPTPQTSSTEAIATQAVAQSVAGSQASGDSGSGSSSSTSRTPQISIIADDVVSELQGQEPASTTNDQSAPAPSDLSKHSFYTPYESPLKRFKAYRYHPQYSHDVSGGYRSLTYSHEIDAMKPVCPFEAAGGICNDSACDGQHFRTMGISEDKVLVQLGIVNPGRTPEEQEKWRADLKQVLKGLREQNVKDAESVAAAIANYRREFLQDPSRVLNI
ncbi:Protein red1 [Lasiodiplodia theobromae]|uniref:Protein red1 n=1 Tax=Lasiodiplodia theobromae TaxID=45133 RepID=A0A5N5DR25_9PEZI|nr:Protein red1 [Lasiodiplodia theobromae]